MPKKKQCHTKPQLVSAQEMHEVEGGACPKHWTLAPSVFPAGVLAAESMLAQFSKTQIRQAVELIAAGFVIGFDANAGDIGMLAVEFAQACNDAVKEPLACVWDNDNSMAYFGRLEDATRLAAERLDSEHGAQKKTAN